jgi:hypothetical protein
MSVGNKFTGSGTITGAGNITIVPVAPTFTYTVARTLTGYYSYGASNGKYLFVSPNLGTGYINNGTVFTVSGVTGPYAAVNGTTFTGTSGGNSEIDIFGTDSFSAALISLGAIPTSGYYANFSFSSVLPGFTINWN